MKKFNKLHLLLIAGILLTVIGSVMLNNSAYTCDTATVTPGTGEVTYICPLNRTDLVLTLLNRNDIFMLEKAILAVGIALIVIWAISLMSIKLGSNIPQPRK